MAEGLLKILKMDKLIKSVLFSVALVSAIVTSFLLAGFVGAKIVSSAPVGLEIAIPIAVFVSCIMLLLAAIKKLSE